MAALKRATIIITTVITTIQIIIREDNLLNWINGTEQLKCQSYSNCFFFENIIVRVYMNAFEIHGGKPLKGEIIPQGAKK